MKNRAVLNGSQKISEMIWKIKPKIHFNNQKNRIWIWIKQYNRTRKPTVKRNECLNDWRRSLEKKFCSCKRPRCPVSVVISGLFTTVSTLPGAVAMTKVHSVQFVISKYIYIPADEVSIRTGSEEKEDKVVRPTVLLLSTKKFERLEGRG